MANVETVNQEEFTEGKQYDCKCTTSGMSNLRVYFIPDQLSILVNRSHLLTFDKTVKLYIGKVNKGITALIGIKEEGLNLRLMLMGETDDFTCKEMEEQ